MKLISSLFLLSLMTGSAWAGTVVHEKPFTIKTDYLKRVARDGEIFGGPFIVVSHGKDSESPWLYLQKAGVSRETIEKWGESSFHKHFPGMIFKELSASDHMVEERNDYRRVWATGCDLWLVGNTPYVAMHGECKLSKFSLNAKFRPVIESKFLGVVPLEQVPATLQNAIDEAIGSLGRDWAQLRQ